MSDLVQRLLISPSCKEMDKEAAHMIQWLDKERDNLIDEVATLQTALKKAYDALQGEPDSTKGVNQ